MGSLGTQLGMLSDALGAALASGIASGMDPAGASFGFSYGRNAQDFADQLANAANNFKSVGYMLEATGYNYKNADAASTVGGAGPAGGVGGEPAETKAGDVPTGPNSMMVPPPLKWSLIQPFLRAIPGIGLFASAAMTWPSGNPSLLRVTAAQWRNLASGLSAFDDDIAALKTAVSVQKIPEGAKIDDALTTLAGGMSKLAEVAPAMAQSIDDFANGVQNAQDAIRRLLDRLSFEGLWDTVTGLLTGEGDNILREVARDVGDVLENFQQQVKGVVGLLGELATAIGDAATAFQKWVRPVLVEAFGEDVGGTLADAVTVYTDFQVGLTTGLINTVSGTVAMADPDTWKGMAEVAMSVAEDPSKLPGVLENMGKEFVAWDQWSGDHPGRAAGEAAFNIGSLFVPGGALSKTGTVAKGLGYTTRLLEERRFPRLGDLPRLGSSPRNVDGLDDLPGIGGGRPPEIPELKPGAIPEQVIGPVAPNGLDAPSIPHSPEIPAGPPDPPGPTGTPGGDNHHGAATGGGPPPDPPGRSVGAPDSGPGRVDAPSPQSPVPSPIDSQQFSESSPPSQAPSVTHHAPETSSPAGAHDFGPAQSDNGQTASHEPSAEATGNGQATEQRGGGSGAGEDPGYRHADANATPIESHRPGSEGYSGGPEEPTHAPADHHPVYVPAADQPIGHEGPATDAPPTREQPQTVSSGDGQHQPVGTAPGVMAGGGAPMGPMAFHASGPTHSVADSPTSAGKTSTPEVSARGADAKVPQAGSAESPRAQAHASPGPAAENTPSAPVKPTAAQHVAGSGGESVREWLGGGRDGLPEPGDRHSDRAVRGGETDGQTSGQPSDSSVPADDRGSPHPGGRPNDRVLDDGAVSGGDRYESNTFTSREEQVEGPRGDGISDHPYTPDTNGDEDPHQLSDDESAQHPGHEFGVNRYVELEDGSQHQVWASNEQLRAPDSRFAAADAWLAEQGLTRAEIQPLLVQPADWLNSAQRELVYGFRHQFPAVASGEGLQKVIDTGQADSRLAGGSEKFPSNETGGSVSIARDTHWLNTPERIYGGLALEYPGSPFAPDKPAIAMRFMVNDNVPVHLPDGQLSEGTGHGPGFDPGYEYPFTGTGFTASDHYAARIFLAGWNSDESRSGNVQNKYRW
jgi:hypothetical protein